MEGWKDTQDGDIHRGMPIPAYTVDEQIYQKCPSIVVSAVDKFANYLGKARGIGQSGAVGSYHQDTGFKGAQRHPPIYFQLQYPRWYFAAEFDCSGRIAPD